MTRRWIRAAVTARADAGAGIDRAEHHPAQRLLYNNAPGGHAMLRAFTDIAGTEWRVWDVVPSVGGNDTITADAISSLKDTRFAGGWLCFESENEKRRLAPIPPGWEANDVPMLERLREQATPVPARLRGQPGAT